MRRQSLCLVMAANQNSGIDVFFGAEFNFWVEIPVFRRAHHYKISKNLFSGCQHQNLLFTSVGLTVPLTTRLGPKKCMFCRQAFRAAELRGYTRRPAPTDVLKVRFACVMGLYYRGNTRMFVGS